MKYRDAIRKSLRKGNGYNGFNNMCFPFLIKGLAVLIGLVCKQALQEERPSAAIEQMGDDEPIEKDDGAAIENPTIDDCIGLYGSLLPVAFQTGWRIDEFLGWLMEQESDEEDFGKMWYDQSALVDKWNEWQQGKVEQGNNA